MFNLFGNSSEKLKSTQHESLVVLGSSSSEVYDYIFGDQEKYYPYWASAWSARGLRKPETMEYVQHILQGIPLSANVILNFGNVDIDYNLRYKIAHEDYQEFEDFATEMAEGILNLNQTLIDMGFDKNRIFASFVAPPVRLDYDYWLSDDIACAPAATNVRGGVLLKACNIVSAQMKAINMLYALSDHVRYIGEDKFYPALSGKFIRDVPDHHQDYIKTQNLIWESMQNIEGLLPRRKVFHQALYQHTGSHIDELKKTKTVRVRTCR